MAFLTKNKERIPLAWRIFLFVLSNKKFYTSDVVDKVGQLKVNTAYNYLYRLSNMGLISDVGQRKTGLGHCWKVNETKLSELTTEFRMEKIR